MSPLFDSGSLQTNHNLIIRGVVTLTTMRKRAGRSFRDVYRIAFCAFALTLIAGCDVQRPIALRIINAATATPIADVIVEKTDNPSCSHPIGKKLVGVTDRAGLFSTTLAEREFLTLRKPGFVETHIGFYAGYFSVVETRPDLLRPATRRSMDEVHIVPSRYRVEFPVTSSEITFGLEPLVSQELNE